MEERGIPTSGKVVAGILVGIFLICGVLMVFFGIKDASKTIGYQSTEGRLVNYTLYSEGDYDPVRKRQTSDTYQLIYHYTVNGQDYTVSTDSGTSFVPEIGSSREIKFNPSNPSEAIVALGDSSSALLFIGMFFIIVPLFFLAVMTGWLKKVSGRVVGLIVGLIFALLGWGSFGMIAGTFSPAGIASYFVSSFSFPLLIPILLIAVGIFLIVANLFGGKKADTEKESSL